MLAGFGAAGGHQGFTVFSRVRQDTVALVACNVVNACPLVEAGVGGAFIDVGLTVWASEAHATGANISAGHILAGASIHTRVGFTLIVVDVTVFTAPARVAQAFIAIDLVFTVTMDAGVAEALIDLGEAGGIMVTFWTHAGEAVDAIDARAAIVAGVDGTLVDIDVTHGTCVAGFTGTLVAIDFVDAGPRVTGIALAVINVDFTVDSCGALGAAADVGVLAVLAGASISARLAQTLVDVGLTQPAGVPRVAVTAEGGQAVDAGTIVARV